MKLLDSIESAFLRATWIDAIPEVIASLISGPVGCAATTPEPSMQDLVERQRQHPEAFVVGKSKCASEEVSGVDLLGEATTDAYIQMSGVKNCHLFQSMEGPGLWTIGHIEACEEGGRRSVAYVPKEKVVTCLK